MGIYDQEIGGKFIHQVITNPCLPVHKLRSSKPIGTHYHKGPRSLFRLVDRRLYSTSHLY